MKALFYQIYTVNFSVGRSYERQVIFVYRLCIKKVLKMEMSHVLFECIKKVMF